MFPLDRYIFVILSQLIALGHDPDYRVSKKDWDTFVETMTDKIIEKDSSIPELPAKDLVCIPGGWWLWPFEC